MRLRPDGASPTTGGVGSDTPASSIEVCSDNYNENLTGNVAEA